MRRLPLLLALAALGLPAAAQTASFQGLGDLPGGYSYSVPYGVSADGSVVVGMSSSGEGGSSSEAFRWTTGGGMVYLGALPGRSFTSLANGVSADGSVVVGEAGGSEAFRWTAGEGMAGLGTLPGYPFSGAQDISADGSVIVGWSRGGLDWGEPFRWTAENGMQNLNSLLVEAGIDLAGWQLTNAIRTSDDGTVIVGVGHNPQGQNEAWRAVLPRVVSADPSPDDGPGFAVAVSPNPGRNRATLRFRLPEAGPVRLALVDALGRTVAVVTEGGRGAGDHTVAVDTSRLPAGVYVARLDAGAQTITKRLTVVR